MRESADLEAERRKCEWFFSSRKEEEEEGKMMGVGVESDEDVSAADIMMRVTCRFGPIPIMVSFVLD